LFDVNHPPRSCKIKKDDNEQTDLYFFAPNDLNGRQAETRDDRDMISGPELSDVELEDTQNADITAKVQNPLTETGTKYVCATIR
jgi:hypothetical protein